MSSEQIVISAEGLGKCYQTYAHPRDRLKQFLLPRFQRALGMRPRYYAHDFWALRNISFQIKKGEAVGVLGKNGSGKSTLLQLITGVLAPTEGQIQVDGRIAALLELGSGFNPEFTGRENVFLNGALLGFSQSEIEDRFEQIASFADIGEFIDQPVKTYSSGMFVRLAFAVQVQLDPEILIVDEALSVGDALFQKRCYQRLEQFLRNGGTLLFVSHDQEAVRTLTDRAILLEGGQCGLIGRSSEVVLEYRRRIHQEEMRYTASRQTEALASAPSEPQVSPEENAITASLDEDKHSYGDFEAYIKKIDILVNDKPLDGAVYPDDQVTIRVTYRFLKPLTNLSFGIRLRNKEGVKIYSGSSLAADILLSQEDPPVQGIWHRHFEIGEELCVDMHFQCLLGEGFYEVQAFVCEEGMLMPGYQRMIHWKDEAAFFTVAIDRLKRWYGGIVDIGVQYDFSSRGGS